jgi:hypothetical protein
MAKQPIDKFELYLEATIKTILKSFDKIRNLDPHAPAFDIFEQISYHASASELVLAQTILTKYRKTKKRNPSLSS